MLTVACLPPRLPLPGRKSLSSLRSFKPHRPLRLCPGSIRSQGLSPPLRSIRASCPPTPLPPASSASTASPYLPLTPSSTTSRLLLSGLPHPCSTHGILPSHPLFRHHLLPHHLHPRPIYRANIFVVPSRARTMAGVVHGMVVGVSHRVQDVRR